MWVYWLSTIDACIGIIVHFIKLVPSQNIFWALHHKNWWMSLPYWRIQVAPDDDNVDDDAGGCFEQAPGSLLVAPPAKTPSGHMSRSHSLFFRVYHSPIPKISLHLNFNPVMWHKIQFEATPLSEQRTLCEFTAGFSVIQRDVNFTNPLFEYWARFYHDCVIKYPLISGAKNRGSKNSPFWARLTRELNFALQIPGRSLWVKAHHREPPSANSELICMSHIFWILVVQNDWDAVVLFQDMNFHESLKPHAPSFTKTINVFVGLN